MTFKITKNDVGRTAILRNGDKVLIGRHERGERGEKYPFKSFDGGADWTADGRFWAGADVMSNYDIIAWADEQDQGKRTPKKEVPGGPSGMSLRDWFAGQVVSGICEKHSVFDAEGWQELAAWNAYCMADAMIAARDKGDAE